eukprot:Rmarinus@m.23864
MPVTTRSQARRRAYSDPKDSYSSDDSDLSVSTSECSEDNLEIGGEMHAMPHWIYDSFSFPLAHVKDTPEYLRESFIHTGYRVGLSYRAAWYSFFRLHNESCNVWTHIAGFFIFLALGVYLFLTTDLADSHWMEQAVFVIFLSSAMIMAVLSVLYHQFSCVGYSAYETLLRMDMAGIANLILGSSFPPVYFGLYCYPMWQCFYLGGMTVLSFLAVGISLTLTGEQYFVHRTALFAALTLFGIFPLMHLHSLHGMEPLYPILNMFYLYALGAVFHVSRFPEALFPGYFDMMPSHSIFHVLVVLAVIVHFGGCVEMYQNHDPMSCSSLPSGLEEFLGRDMLTEAQSY